MFVFEAKVFQLGLYLVQSQTVGERSVDIQCLTGYLILFACRLTGQCTHVVQTVADLYENDAYVVAHGEQ